MSAQEQDNLQDVSRQKIDILLVDDNPKNLLALEVTLNDLDQNLVKAHSGEEALKKVLGRDFALILLDIQMPGMDGFETAKLIRQRERTRHVPIIFLTAAYQLDSMKGYSLGAVDYLLKPIVPEILRAKVSAFVELFRRSEEIRLKEQMLRERAEEALSASEASYRLLFDNSPRPMWVYDTRTLVFLAVNDAAVDKYGYSREEFLKMTIKDIRPPEEVGALMERLARAPQRLENSGNFRHRKKDGSIINVEIASHVLTFGGKLARLVLADDVTEKTELEVQLRQAQKLEGVGQLAGGIAHDFNNLLTVIMGRSQMLQRKLERTSPFKRDVDLIHTTAERAATLTRQLLAFSRKQLLQPRVLDLNTVVADMDKMLQRLIGEHIELATILHPELGRAKVDPGQMEQVILNLAVNARDAMPEGGKLTIETANVELDENYTRQHVTVQPGRYVMLAVTDAGCGMDAQTQARIFEPFFTTKEPGKGTGLGLSTVYGIVKQSGGNIWVYSELGHGTTFKVYLPRLDDAADSVVPASEDNHKVKGSETILLVEDEETVREMSEEILRDQGYRVLVASNGEEAIKICKNYEGVIHVVVTDVVMPKLSGPELARQLKTLRPDTRTLFLSGYTNASINHNEVLSADAEFLQKPFSTEAFTGKIRRILDTGTPHNS